MFKLWLPCMQCLQLKGNVFPLAKRPFFSVSLNKDFLVIIITYVCVCVCVCVHAFAINGVVFTFPLLSGTLYKSIIIPVYLLSLSCWYFLLDKKELKRIHATFHLSFSFSMSFVRVCVYVCMYVQFCLLIATLLLYN